VRLWRLTRPVYIPGLDGEGARLWGGTWNSPGLPMVYLSSSLALAALEVLVNLPPRQRQPSEFPPLVALAVDIDPENVADPGLPARQEVAKSRTYGDSWLRSASSLGLSVPSRVIPLERNILLNPRHPAMASVKVAVTEPFVFDDRLTY
jgi:RES domain-containing protein